MAISLSLSVIYTAGSFFHKSSRKPHLCSTKYEPASEQNSHLLSPREGAAEERLCVFSLRGKRPYERGFLGGSCPRCWKHPTREEASRKKLANSARNELTVQICWSLNGLLLHSLPFLHVFIRHSSLIFNLNLENDHTYMHGYIETCSAHVDTEFGPNRLQQVGDYKCKSLTNTGFLGLRKLR